jgi:hypothetical protein
LELKISIEEKKGVNIEKYVENKLHIKIKINGKNKMEKLSIGIQTCNPPFVRRLGFYELQQPRSDIY